MDDKSPIKEVCSRSCHQFSILGSQWYLRNGCSYSRQILYTSQSI